MFTRSYVDSWDVSMKIPNPIGVAVGFLQLQRLGVHKDDCIQMLTIRLCSDANDQTVA